MGENALLSPKNGNFDLETLTGKNTDLRFISPVGKSAHQIACHLLADESPDETRCSRPQDESDGQVLTNGNLREYSARLIMRFFRSRMHIGVKEVSCVAESAMARSLLVGDRMRELSKAQ